MSKRKSTQFNCFSPPVMLATLTIETALAIYTVVRYKMNTLSRLIVGLLLGLATFQLAEYHVCTGPGPGAIPWSRLGFVAISTLPPLGLHLMHVMAGKPKRRLVIAGYTTLALFSTFFLLGHNTFTGHKCTGNYVIFQFSDNVTGTYSLYYYGWILTGIGLGMRWANELKAQGKKSLKKLQSVQALILGYLVFLVPTGIANTVKPETRRGIPSIMCGFAVLLALILALYILPRMATLKQKNTSREHPAHS